MATSINQIDTPDAYWSRGVNSILEPTLLKSGEYQWGSNIDNMGAIIQTRQGFNLISKDPTDMAGKVPKGMKIFKDKNNIISMVIAAGDKIYAARYPFQDFLLVGDGFASDNTVVFERVVRSATTNADTGARTIISPTPLLIMQDGISRAKVWDGTILSTSDPSDAGVGIPIGRWMQWSNGRLWVSSDRTLHASDLFEPLVFFEENFVAGGGAIYFQDDITGLFQTPDLRSLLVGTDFNTSVVQSGVLDRTQWGLTTDFQKVLLPGIGVASGFSFCHQYGMTWWYAHKGLIRLDSALNTYRTSSIRFSDQLMMRGKVKLSSDISGIVIKAFGNYLLVAVPYGDSLNAQIWVLNQKVLNIEDESDSESWAGSWSGLRTVQMESTVIRGEQRIFALSEDTSFLHGTLPNIWELFMGSRDDTVNPNIFQRIPCSWESRVLGFSEDMKKFDYAELEIAEIKGTVDIEVFVSSRRGGYHSIMKKKIVATEGNINADIDNPAVTQATGDTIIGFGGMVNVESTEGFLPAPSHFYVNGRRVSYNSMTLTSFQTVDLDKNILTGDQIVQSQYTWDPNDNTQNTLIESFVPQRRILRSSGWNLESGPESCPVESSLTDNVDRGFSILVKWKGKMALTGLRIFASKRDEFTVGKCEPDEILSRSLDAFGEGDLSDNIEETITTTGVQPYNRMCYITPKYTDEDYSSYTDAI